MTRLTDDPGVRQVNELLQQALSGCALLGLEKTGDAIREAVKKLKKEAGK